MQTEQYCRAHPCAEHRDLAGVSQTTREKKPNPFHTDELQDEEEKAGV